MQNGGIVIVNTSLVEVGSSVVSATWNGGRGVLVVSATQYAPIFNLMLDKVGPTGVAIKMNTSAIQANMVLPLDLPAGTYSVHSATGSSIGVYAALMPTR